MESLWTGGSAGATMKVEARTMTKYLISVCLLFAFLLAGCLRPVAPLPSGRPTLQTLDGQVVPSDRLEALINARMAAADVTGISCAIINDGHVVYRQAFGVKDSRSGARNDEETVFAAASLGKPVFAYLVLLLAEEGIVYLDKPLYEYLRKPLPEYPNYADLHEDERYKQITARMALSHTTGFPNWRTFAEDGRLAIMFEPGTRFSYSGEGIALLQMVIEELTEQDLEALAQARVFGPLRMHRTSYVWQTAYEDDFALPHDEFGRSRSLIRSQSPSAAGSLVTTAGDYAHFLAALLNASGERKTLVEEMLQPQIAITSQSMFGPGASLEDLGDRAVPLAWGVGWGRFDSAQHGRAFFHTGHDLGWQSYTVTYPDRGIGIVLLSNSDNFESVAKEIVANAIGDTDSPFDWLGYIPFDPASKKASPPQPLAVAVDPAILAAYAGVYKLASGQELTVKLKQGSLYVTGGDGAWAQLEAESAARFFIAGEHIRFEFVQGGGGTVIGLNLRIQGLELAATKMK